MIPSVDIYNDVRFIINKENGYLNADDFNDRSWNAQLRFLSWLSGGETGLEIPQQYVSQKNRDWLSPFLLKYPAQISGGFISKPADYYLFDNIYKLNGKKRSDCNDVQQQTVTNKSIDLLSNNKFYERVNSDIEELKPSASNPICKMLENKIELYPVDLGSVVMEYIRYPSKAAISSSEDPATHDEIITSVTNFEWNEYARPLLTWFIVDEFANHTRESALKQDNAASSPIRK